MGRVTIADVAERTGFSKTTISRFLNGKYEFMSETTRKRISEVIKDIEYKPIAWREAYGFNKVI